MATYPPGTRKRVELLRSLEGKTLDEQLALYLPFEYARAHRVEMMLYSDEEKKKYNEQSTLRQNRMIVEFVMEYRAARSLYATTDECCKQFLQGYWGENIEVFQISKQYDNQFDVLCLNSFKEAALKEKKLYDGGFNGHNCACLRAERRPNKRKQRPRSGRKRQKHNKKGKSSWSEIGPQ